MNKGSDEQFFTNTRSVGKTCKSMGLETAHLPDKSGRGPKITPEFIEKIKNTLGKRPKRPKRPTFQNSEDKLPFSNVRQTSQTSGASLDPCPVVLESSSTEVPTWEF